MEDEQLLLDGIPVKRIVTNPADYPKKYVAAAVAIARRPAETIRAKYQFYQRHSDQLPPGVKV